ncbi:MAG: class I SAM-dependent methyltransferase [Acidobacteriota bacterium]
MAGPRTFPDHFSSAAAEYARHRPDYPAELFDYLAALAPGRRRAWDCATGSGQAAVGLARLFREVLATDASAQQISQARPHARVRYRVAPADDSGLEAGSVDLVTVAQALHWFDRPRFWQEARRVLLPGGVIAVWCYDLMRADEEVAAVIRRFYRDVVGPYWPPERVLTEQRYRTIDFPFPEETPPPFRMEKRWSLPDLVGYLGTWSAVRRYRETLGEDPVGPVSEQLARVWGPPDRPRRVFWDLALRVGRNA